VKEPSPQSLGCFTSSSIKQVRFFENFEKPKIGIYFRNLSKTLNEKSFDCDFEKYIQSYDFKKKSNE